MATQSSPLSNLPAIPSAIHGPYEDAIIAGFSLLEKVLATVPAADQAKMWNDFLTFSSGLQTLAAKLDVFHLVTTPSSS
jgi:hypothetical protein